MTEKAKIVIGNYIKKDIDESTPPTEAYVRGFMRCLEKERAVICVRTTQRNVLQERNESLVVENAKLRDIVRRFFTYADQDRCEGCVYKKRCNNGDIHVCWQFTEICKRARDAGFDFAKELGWVVSE